LLVVLAFVVASCSNAKGQQTGTSTPTGAVKPYTGTNFSTNVPVAAPGVTSKEINVGSISAKTNPVGLNVPVFDEGIKAYFDYINSKGGVWGRTIHLTKEIDDNLVMNDAASDQMLAQNNIYAVFEAAFLFAGANKLAAAGIPTFGAYIGNAEWAGPQNFFPNIRPECLQGCAPEPHLAPYVAQQVHAHKVAVLAFSVKQSAACGQGVVKEFGQFGDDVGAHIVFNDQSLGFGSTVDFSPQISKIKDAGADFVVMCMDKNTDESVEKEAVKQGIKNKVTFYAYSTSNLYDPPFVEKNAKDLEGTIVEMAILAREHQPQIPAMKQFLDYANSHGLEFSEYTLQGWIAAMQFVDALKYAGPHFTWHQLIGAWNQQKWANADGLVPPADWTINHGDPTNPANLGQFECANFVQVHDGKFVPLWDDNGRKPWVCFNASQPNVWHPAVHLSFATDKPFNITDQPAN
jgi:ABC-type branched-subunit amino acid transport system substrate-binding protein